MDPSPNDEAIDDVLVRIWAELCRSKVGGLEKMADEGMNRESRTIMH